MVPWWALTSTEASAGPWVRELGSTYAQLSWAHGWSTQVFTPSGVAAPRATLMGPAGAVFDRSAYRSDTLAAYLEVGLSHGFEVDASLPYRSASNRLAWAEGPLDPIVARNHGFGDPMVAARWGRSVRSVALSTLAAVHAPLYDNDPALLGLEVGNSDPYDDRVPLGAGTIDVDLGGGVGVPLPVAAGWGLAEAAVRVRDRRFSEGVAARIQVGVKPVRRVATWLGADGYGSFDNGAAPDRFHDQWGKGPIAVDRQSWLTATLGTSVDLGHGLAPLLTATRVLVARSSSLDTTITLGISLCLP